jgi:hypothetical protein
MDLPSPETRGVRERWFAYELQGIAMEALRSALTGRGVCPTFLAFVTVAAEVEQAMEGLGFPD